MARLANPQRTRKEVIAVRRTIKVQRRMQNKLPVENVRLLKFGELDGWIAFLHGKKARRKKTPVVVVHYCMRHPMGCYPVVLGRRSLRFLRNAIIGFPQRPQNEN
jgi:hypothetical protein